MIQEQGYNATVCVIWFYMDVKAADSYHTSIACNFNIEPKSTQPLKGIKEGSCSVNLIEEEL